MITTTETLKKYGICKEVKPMQVDAETYLKEISKCEARIYGKIAEIKRLECLATSVTAALCDDKVQTSGISDKIGNIVVQIETEKEKLQKAIEHFFEVKSERIALIEQLDNVLDYKVIHGKYVRYLKFKDIAKEEHFSEQYIREVHIRALENFQILLNNLYKPIESE